MKLTVDQPFKIDQYIKKMLKMMINKTMPTKLYGLENYKVLSTTIAHWHLFPCICISVSSLPIHFGFHLPHREHQKHVVVSKRRMTNVWRENIKQGNVFDSNINGYTPIVGIISI